MPLTRSSVLVQSPAFSSSSPPPLSSRPSNRPFSASIIAKVTRDHLIEKWQWKGVGQIDSNYGSGYPGDEACVNWFLSLPPLDTSSSFISAVDRMSRSLHPIFGYPTDFVRFSWSTTKTVFTEHNAVQVDW
jgi:ribonuclease HII